MTSQLFFKLLTSRVGTQFQAQYHNRLFGLHDPPATLDPHSTPFLPCGSCAHRLQIFESSQVVEDLVPPKGYLPAVIDEDGDYDNMYCIEDYCADMCVYPGGYAPMYGDPLSYAPTAIGIYE